MVLLSPQQITSAHPHRSPSSRSQTPSLLRHPPPLTTLALPPHTTNCKFHCFIHISLHQQFATSLNRITEATEAQKLRLTYLNEDYVPVYLALGMIRLALAFGTHTAMHQLRYAPNVQVSKKKMEKVLGVEESDYVTEEVDKFVKNSFFRKLAHVQDFERERTVPDNIRSDVYTRGPKVSVPLTPTAAYP